MVGVGVLLDGTPLRREGRAERMARGPWEGPPGKTACAPVPLPKAGPQTEDVITRRGDGHLRALHSPSGQHVPTPSTIPSELLCMIWKREGAPDGHG